MGFTISSVAARVQRLSTLLRASAPLSAHIVMCTPTSDEPMCAPCLASCRIASPYVSITTWAHECSCLYQHTSPNNNQVIGCARRFCGNLSLHREARAVEYQGMPALQGACRCADRRHSQLVREGRGCACQATAMHPHGDRGDLAYNRNHTIVNCCLRVISNNFSTPCTMSLCSRTAKINRCQHPGFHGANWA